MGIVVAHAGLGTYLMEEYGTIPNFELYTTLVQGSVNIFVNDFTPNPQMMPGDFEVPGWSYNPIPIAAAPQVNENGNTGNWELRIDGVTFIPTDYSAPPVDVFGWFILNSTESQVVYACRWDESIRVVSEMSLVIFDVVITLPEPVVF